MAEVARLVVSWVVTTTAIFVIVLRDERHLKPALLDRAWPPPSRVSAIVAFGVLCLPVHFGRTRRSVLGVLYGFVWLVLVSVLDALAQAATLLAFGMPLGRVADYLLN